MKDLVASACARLRGWKAARVSAYTRRASRRHTARIKTRTETRPFDTRLPRQRVLRGRHRAE